jgi:hypothetical protein
VNIQPVVPIALGSDWHMISRTIFPVMLKQDDLFPGAGSQFGLRDTTEGLYFSPETFSFTCVATDLCCRPRRTICSGAENGSRPTNPSLAGRRMVAGVPGKSHLVHCRRSDRLI